MQVNTPTPSHEWQLSHLLLCCAVENQIEWRWPKGYVPLECVLQDRTKLDAITEVQRRLGVAPKNYMRMAQSTNFALDKHTIVRYLEGE